MPCSNENHRHEWPDSGTLFICRCENKCGFCSADAEAFSTSTTLRTHVKEIHLGGEYPDKEEVVLERGKTGRVKE